MTTQDKQLERVKEMFSLGLVFTGESCRLDDIEVSWVEILTEDDESWSKLYNKIKIETERRKKL